MARQEKYSTIRIEGSLITYDQLKRIIAGDAEGVSSESYGLVPGEKINEVISQDWDKALKLWQSFQNSLDSLPETDPATTITRDRWFLPLLNLIGYGRLQPARNIQVNSVSYAISHMFAQTPIHILGCRTKLDTRTAGLRGAARISPHGLVQEYLNKSETSLWGIVTNGYSLRLLRDNANVARMTYVEFNLLSMMETQSYSDFVAFWMLLHASRFESATGQPETSLIEKWSKMAVESGVRALDDLRLGVESALKIFGNGYLKEPTNESLRQKIQAGELSAQVYLQQLMRLVYRLIFIFVAEDRDLLLVPNSPDTAEARQRYLRYYSTSSIRSRCRRMRKSQHIDLWEKIKITMKLLYTGYEPLALPALGSFLWSQEAIADLHDAKLSNESVLLAFKQLCWKATDNHSVMSVDWNNLGSEELGSIYESLLEYVPAIQIGADEAFVLNNQAGNERKTTGSYYTPTTLIVSLLETALMPVIKKKIENKSTEDAKVTLLQLKVCDPSCGSGHFLVAAAHRIARQLAILETGDDEPAPDALRAALRRVISKCIYGVDLNPMSVELCKVALWMESMEQGKPLSFLDHHIKCGNSLMGTTPKLISEGIPNEVFDPITGDDAAYCKILKKSNREYRKKYESGQQSFFTAVDFGIKSTDWNQMIDYLSRVNNIEESSLSEVQAVEKGYKSLLNSKSWQDAKLIADAWCTAFTQKKVKDNTSIIDEARFGAIRANPSRVDDKLSSEIEKHQTEYRFFHWHLEFIDVFHPVEKSSANNQGWTGGFDVVLGNPPWDKPKMEEVPWFSQYDPDIATARTSAIRKAKIKQLIDKNPRLHTLFEEAKRYYEAFSEFLHNSGLFSLSAVGDVNTYMVFSELNRNIINSNGRAGFIVPSGIATDKGTSTFFGDLAQKNLIASLYAFENRFRLFLAVDSRTRFCLLTLAGKGSPVNEADYAFFLESVDDLNDDNKHFSMAGHELKLFNPNTGNCPTFRSKHDKAIAQKIYSKLPVLINEGKDGQSDRNPWGIQYKRLFDMSNDSHLFWAREMLENSGWTRVSNRWEKDGQWMVPLYEGKMFYQFDHRYATYKLVTNDTNNTAQLPKSSDEEHANPTILPEPQYWIMFNEVDQRLKKENYGVICFRDIARATDQRTMISCVIPWNAFGNKAPILTVQANHREYIHIMSAIMNSMVFDFITRMSVGGASMNFYIVKQLPCLEITEIKKAPLLFELLNKCCIELTYTSWDMLPWMIEYVGICIPPIKWNSQRRYRIANIINSIVALYFGLDKNDVEYILDSFSSIRDEEISKFGHFRMKEEIISYFDVLNNSKDKMNLANQFISPEPLHPTLLHHYDDFVAEKMPWIEEKYWTMIKEKQ